MDRPTDVERERRTVGEAKQRRRAVVDVEGGVTAVRQPPTAFTDAARSERRVHLAAHADGFEVAEHVQSEIE